jgi:hypothetical protein
MRAMLSNVEPKERVDSLIAGASAYAAEVSEAYDEVVEQVAARVAEAGSLGWFFRQDYICPGKDLAERSVEQCPHVGGFRLVADGLSLVRRP